MKNSKLKFSEYMQNISRFKSFGKFVLIVHLLYRAETERPFLIISEMKMYLNSELYKIMNRIKKNISTF